MPRISKKGIEMPSSPIRKLAPLAEEAIQKGHRVYQLNIGQPDIKTPEVALAAIRNLPNKTIEYTHSAGNKSYRTKIASHYRHLGINVQASEIMITTGGSEAILFTFLATVNPGEEIIITEPFYANYNAYATMAGIKLVPLESKIEDGFALPAISEFKKLINEKTKAILICNPNNPTGYLYTKEEMESLGQLVKEHDLYLFSDEVYREFVYDGNKHYSAMGLPGLEEHVVMFDSVSKRYSSCGLRIGALITKNKDVFGACMKFAQARLSPPSLGQIAGEASLDVPQSYFDGVYDEYIERRNYMVEALNKMEGVVCPMPKGAFYSIVKLPIDDCDKFCQWILSEFEYKKQTVMMAPGTGFYSTPGKGQKEVRIAYVLKIEDLRNAMETLEHALLAYPGRTLA